jgi:cell wall-associated NlpC family hydrolase
MIAHGRGTPAPIHAGGILGFNAALPHDHAMTHATRAGLSILALLVPLSPARGQSSPEEQFRRANERISRGGTATSARAPVRSEAFLGRLGVITQTTNLPVTRSSASAVLARVEAGTYVCLRSQSPRWYGLLMADRTLGWTQKARVRMLDFNVVGSAGRAAPSMGGSEGLSGGQRTVIEVAYSFLGIPYKWGGTTGAGIDCSAFVQKCFASAGVRLPRTAAEQSRYGSPVPVELLQTADRLYFASSNGRISHTGIYLGNGYFIHSSTNRRGVAISALNEAPYAKMYAGARR